MIITNQVIDSIFSKIEQNFLKNNYQVIIIPSMRTPQNIIEKAKELF